MKEPGSHKEDVTSQQLEEAFSLVPGFLSDRRQKCVWHREAVPDMGVVMLRCAACGAEFPEGPGRYFEGRGAVRPEDIGDRLREMAEGRVPAPDLASDAEPCPACGQAPGRETVQVQLFVYAHRNKADLVCVLQIRDGVPDRKVRYFMGHGDGTFSQAGVRRAELSPFLTESAFRAALGEADFSGEGRFPPSLRSCLQLDPDFPPALELKAQIRLSAGRLEEAAAGFRRVIELDDTRRLSWQGLGLCLQELYRNNPKRNGTTVLKQAGECLLKALELEDTPSVRRAVGGFFAMAGKADEARPHLEAALAADPDHPATNYNLAVVHLAAGDPKGALPLLDKAISGLPRDADARRRRAECLMNLERYMDAFQELERARELAPRDPRIERLGKELTLVQRQRNGTA